MRSTSARRISQTFCRAVDSSDLAIGSLVIISFQAVCIAGDWMAHMFYDVEGDTTFGDLQLSPGDLDEAILGIIQVSTGSDDTEPGSVFELLSAYRQGVLQRIGSCGL